jgi:hypothetical protein
MTTLTTILGLVPMAFFRAGRYHDPADRLTVIGGLTSSTLITLFFIRSCTLPERENPQEGGCKLKRIEIMANRSVQTDIQEGLESAIDDFYYTCCRWCTAGPPESQARHAHLAGGEFSPDQLPTMRTPSGFRDHRRHQAGLSQRRHQNFHDKRRLREHGPSFSGRGGIVLHAAAFFSGRRARPISAETGRIARIVSR